MRVYLDDEREAPKGWERVYTPDQAITLLRTGNVEVISLDHDLGEMSRSCYTSPITGYDVLTFIEEAVINDSFVPPKILIHTANPSARDKMMAGVRSIMKRYNAKIKNDN